MGALLNGARKFLFAAALLVLIVFCGYFYYAFSHVDDTLLREKFIDRRFNVDLICGEVDKFVELDNDWDVYDYRAILSYVVAMMDAADENGSYAELFDAQLNSLSERSPLFDGSPFDPRACPALVRAIYENERGEMTVRFKGQEAEPHDLHVCFRWVPTDKTLDHRLLVIAGVSKYSINTGIGVWVTYGAIALIIAAAIFILGAVILLCQLGYIYTQRENKGGIGIWRGKISS